MGRDLGSGGAVDALLSQPLRNILTTLREGLDVRTRIAGEFPFAALPTKLLQIAWGPRPICVVTVS